MIDAHCHLEFGQFDGERKEVIERSKERIEGIVDSCAEIEKMDGVLELHEKNEDFIFPCLGLHPTRAVEASWERLKGYMEKIRNNRERIVGLGEVGLDYHHLKEKKKRERSKEIFEDFVELSNELDLPLVVHSRGAMEDAFDVLQRKDGDVLVHCFSGDEGDLREAMDRGYSISLGGIVFRSKRKYRRIIEEVPLENLLLETDAPFLARNKGDKSYPWDIRDVARRIAGIKETEFGEVWRQSGRNASEFFELPIDI